MSEIQRCVRLAVLAVGVGQFAHEVFLVSALGAGWRRGGVDFLRQGNKFLHIDDYALAQRCLRQQLDRQWPHLLNSFLPLAFPTMGQTLGPHLSYYWTLWQSEWATDLIMNTPAELTATMASLLRHAWITGNSANVLRYLDRPLTAAGKPDGRCTNEVMSRVLDFHDGLRVRHWVDHNSVKVYNEQNVLQPIDG